MKTTERIKKDLNRSIAKAGRTGKVDKRLNKIMLSLIMMVLVASLSLAGCGKADEAREAASTTSSTEANYDMVGSSPAPEMAYDEETAEMAPTMPYGGAATSDSMEMNQYLDKGQNGQVDTISERKIIKTGYVYMETLDYDQTLLDLKQLIDKYFAYTSYSQSNDGSLYERGYNSRSSRFTIKVPANNFEIMYEELRTIGHVLNANEGKEDVTSQFVDIESRLKTLGVQEERLLAILEKSEKLEDVIELEYALQDVRYEIERYTSSLRDLSDRVSYSTLEVNVQEVFEETVVEKPVITFGDKITSGLEETFDELKTGAENLIIFLITQFPYLIFLGLIGLFGFILFKKLKVKDEADIKQATKEKEKNDKQ